ncbi:MAG: phBC6A51 family helix-turn-helix protein [Agriterribacter sp.]
MAKYTKKRVEKIVTLLESGDYTIKEICEIVKIHQDTWYDWKHNKPEFSELLEKADEKRMEVFKQAARIGLLALLRGKEYEEVTKEYAEVDVPDGKGKTKKEPRMISQKIVKKVILPNPAAVIFTLKNQDPDNFKDINRTDITTLGKQLPAPKNDPLAVTDNKLVISVVNHSNTEVIASTIQNPDMP